MTGHGYQDASVDPDQITLWWQRHPLANIGFPTGAASGLLVLDIDPRNGGDVDDLPGKWDSTAEVISGGGGRHVYFRFPGGKFPKTPWPGVDLQGEGALVLAPPSLHRSGRRYEWDGLREGDDLDNLADPPDWLMGLRITDNLPDSTDRVRMMPAKLPDVIPDGKKHYAIVSLAGTCLHRGLPVDGAFAACRALNFASTVSDQDIWERVRNVYARYAEPAEKPAAPSPFAMQVKAIDRWATGDNRKAYDDARGLTPSLAEAIMDRHHFAKDAGGRLYVYQGGTYRPGAEVIIRTETRDLMETWGKLPKWKSGSGDDVAQYICDAHTPALADRPPMDSINLLNGILDLNTMTLVEHTPEYLSPIQLAVKYDPGAQCPAWERWVSQTLPDDAQDIVWETAAWLITPDVSHQKAILLSGPGGNGKSVLLDGLMTFLGRDNVANRTLHSLEDNRFACVDLVGRLANICADLPPNHLNSTSMFKAIVSGDRISVEQKREHAFSITPYARLVFSANSLPKSGDSSDGFYRRWLVIPFTRSFDGSRERRNKRELDAELQDPAELSGLLNRALAVLPRLRKQGFTECGSMREAAAEFREITDPLAVWLERRTERDPAEQVDAKELLFTFNKEVSQPNNLAYISAHTLTKALSAKGIEKKKYWKTNALSYFGLKFKTGGAL
jgi:putative DNA primase/helicase